MAPSVEYETFQRYRAIASLPFGSGWRRRKAELGNPYVLAFDKDGNLYVSQPDLNRVLRIDTAGVIRTVAGTGEPGFSGDGGPAIKAKLNTPNGLAFDGEGNLYIADTGNHRVRRIDKNQVITTFSNGNR